MIWSYLDESFDMGGRGVFVVGALLGRGGPILELERRWQKLRKRPDIDIDYFKASECWRGDGQFAKFVKQPRHPTDKEREKLNSISHSFLRLITNPLPFDSTHYFIIQGVGVIQKDFRELIGTNSKAKAVLGDSPHRLAYDMAMIQCAWTMKQLSNENDEGEEYETSFICDEHEKYSALALDAYRNLKLNNSEAAKYMDSFAMKDEKKLEPLQAADASAFEVRRALNISLKQWPGELRKQFNLLAEAKAMFLIAHTSKEQLEWIVQNHEPGEPFKLDALMQRDFNKDVRF